MPRLNGMKRPNLAIISIRTIFILLFFSSCEQDAYFIVPEGYSKLHAISEISPNQKIKVRVSTSIGVNTQDDFIFPEQSDAEVILYENGVALDDPGFRYISSEKAFVSQGSFRTKEGVEYGLSVSMKDDININPIFASATIPHSIKLEDVKITDVKTIKSSNLGNDVSFKVAASLEGVSNDYFIIRPYYLNKSGVKKTFLVKNILEGNSGAFQSEYAQGVLINKIKSGDMIQLSLETAELLATNDELSLLYIEVLSLSADSYSYYKCYNNQIEAQGLIISEPVISYTNFEGGLGVFSAYSQSIASFKFPN